MITIQEVNAKRLLYEPAKLFKASHALRLGNDTFATLREEKLFNSFDKVTVESADGAWMFEQKGTFNRLVMVNEIGSNARSALFVYNRGMLELRNGRKYHWKGKRRFPIQWDSGLKFDKGPDISELRWSRKCDSSVAFLSTSFFLLASNFHTQLDCRGIPRAARF